jgi:probable HAF family extracellular repeat protein
MKNKLSKLALAGLLSLTAVSANAATFTLLEKLGGANEQSIAGGINDLGQVVGSSDKDLIGDSFGRYAVQWDATTGLITRLPRVGGSWGGGAVAINNSGQAVGFSDQSGARLPYSTNGVTSNNLNVLGRGYGYATDINSSGQISGVAGFTERAFVWTNGTPTDLGTLGGSLSGANGINNSSQVAGSSKINGDLATHATLWVNGIATDLGTLGGTNSYGYGINDLGQVVGRSDTASGAQHAALWINGIATDLGTLGGNNSFAFGINNSGQIIGWSDDINGTKRATLWENGLAVDLNSWLDSSTLNAGWVLSEAYDINTSGQIVGYATNSLLGVVSQGYVLTPVPEADTSAMLLMGAGVIGFMARRSKQVAA